LLARSRSRRRPARPPPRHRETPEPLIVAGRGNLGRSLARALPARLVAARTGFQAPTTGIVFLAVPDGAIGETAARIAALEPPPAVAFVHLSGALGLDVLAPLQTHPVGSFHPLQSFPTPRGPAAFRGITIAIDASTPALRRRLVALARRLGAKPKLVGDRQRVAYHAAAVFASNFVDVVISEAVHLLTGVGWTEAEATSALLPLVEGAVENIRRRGTVLAMTGPIRRGDADTVRRHLAVVGSPDLYRMLGTIALEISRQAGLEPAAAERVKRALTQDVAATRRRRR
jgi:predicted short-subunit dehydrogenase-like oxidoreductase (DUF2520 family)